MELGGWQSVNLCGSLLVGMLTVDQCVGVQIHLRHLANLGVNDCTLLMARSVGEGEEYFDAQPTLAEADEWLTLEINSCFAKHKHTFNVF